MLDDDNSHMPELQKKQKRIWTPDQVRKIIEEAPIDFKPLVTLVALTGIRLGELLALQWKHVDFRKLRKASGVFLWGVCFAKY
jgi:integrase